MAAEVIGRDDEKAELDRLLASATAELVVVYGRRRIGKTFLIRQHLKSQLVFELAGLHNESLTRQLENFAIQLKSHSGKSIEIPTSWLQAFEQLKAWLSKTKANGKRVVFLMNFHGLPADVRDFCRPLRRFGIRSQVGMFRWFVSSVVPPHHG